MPHHVSLDHWPPRSLSRRAYAWIAGALLLFALGGVAVAEDSPGTLKPSQPLVAPGSAPNGQSLPNAEQSSASNAHIKELIRQLGDKRYTSRRAAANELRRIGAEAFDLLHEATTDSDPEVAASSRYLLREISIRWMQADDPPAVRTLLRDYDRQSDAIRLRRVDDLAELANSEGIGGLCRIARFDRSPVVSRMAALAIIRPENNTASPSRVEPEVVDRELGASTRVAADWLRRYLAQVRDPGASVDVWQKLIDEESARLEKNTADTTPKIVSGLLWNLADVYRQTGNGAALVGVIDRMVEVDPEESDDTSIELLEWLWEHKSWDVLDDFLTKHHGQLEKNKRPLYYAALARAKQGKKDDAETLAEKAAKIDPQNALESFLTAKDLEEHNQFEWAVREYRRSINDEKVASHEGILCRIYLASLLQDYEKFQEAGDVLEPLAKAMKSEGQVGQLYTELQRYYRGRLSLPPSEAVPARFHFYRACQHHAAKDYKQEQSELDLAIKFDRTDADVLIAMFRLPGADPEWHEGVQKRIRDLAREFQQEIDENPADPNNYNQWAWLVSNTEGDFQKAVRYSHRSIELIPSAAGDSAGGSFLDTLGRCYFATGDYENAVKYEREAIKKVDYMQVMHRQLAEFENALAQKSGARSKEQGADDTQKKSD